jgi:hypothetical protein
MGCHAAGQEVTSVAQDGAFKWFAQPVDARLGVGHTSGAAAATVARRQPRPARPAAVEQSHGGGAHPATGGAAR